MLRDAVFSTYENGRGASGPVNVGKQMIDFSSDIDENSVHKEWSTLSFYIDGYCADCRLNMFKITPKRGQLQLMEKATLLC